MSPFAAALSTLCLTYGEAAGLLRNREGGPVKESMVKDWARGKSRVPDDVWEQLTGLFEQVEAAADELLADQGEFEIVLETRVEEIDLPHPKLRLAAAVRAKLVLGLGLIVLPEPEGLDA